VCFFSIPCSRAYCTSSPLVFHTELLHNRGEPYESVEVATRITLFGQQSDTDPTQHDLVEFKTFEQSFWRAQGTFTVNSVLDLHDGNMGDGIADTGLPNNPPSGITTLRAALEEADSDIQLDVIRFNIPGDAVPIIKPNAALGHSARSSP
jgi:hypothetical protein